MFVIPSKNNPKLMYATQLVDQIRKFTDELIVVIDSDSDDKKYLEDISLRHNVVVEDIKNKNWMVGAFWYAAKKYDDDFYFFMHDSMIVKDNLDYIKQKPLTILCHFDRTVNDTFNAWQSKIQKETKYKYLSQNGLGVYGPMFFCQNKVIKNMLDKGVDVLLPTCKAEVGYMEGAIGAMLEEDGFDLKQCSMYGNILELESVSGKSGLYPHKTSWQYPIEKFYGHHFDPGRL